MFRRPRHPLALTIVTSTPVPGTPTLSPGSDSGFSNSDGITNVTRPLITGTGLAGDTVTLRDGATTVGLALVGAGGIWSAITSTLGAGPHVLTATEKDVAGNVSTASPALNLTIDTTIPVAGVDAGAGGCQRHRRDR